MLLLTTNNQPLLTGVLISQSSVVRRELNLPLLPVRLLSNGGNASVDLTPSLMPELDTWGQLRVGVDQDL